MNNKFIFYVESKTLTKTNASDWTPHGVPSWIVAPVSIFIYFSLLTLPSSRFASLALPSRQWAHGVWNVFPLHVSGCRCSCGHRSACLCNISPWGNILSHIYDNWPLPAWEVRAKQGQSSTLHPFNQCLFTLMLLQRCIFSVLDFIFIKMERTPSFINHNSSQTTRVNSCLKAMAIYCDGRTTGLMKSIPLQEDTFRLFPLPNASLVPEDQLPLIR